MPLLDIEKIVENIQQICRAKGITPTVAAKESGAGQNMVTAMKKEGRIPSVEKMSMLAAYLGVTTSDLLGEKKEPALVAEGGPKLNKIQIAGRDGSFLERELTDEQLAALKVIVDQLPDADDL